MNNLYKGKNAEYFSQTRSQPWRGWVKCLEYLKNIENFSVLDLGCGNGRYLDFLTSQDLTIEKYVGLDSSIELLEIAQKKYSEGIRTATPLNPLLANQASGSRGEIEKVKFIEHDLNSRINLDGKFNHIVLWAVLHHIELTSRRIEIIREAIEHLENDGVLAITFWQFGNNKEFLEKHKIQDLSNNDYILSFGKEKSKRFCHHFSDEEITSILKGLDSINIISKYQSDGFNDNMNCYVIIQKI